MKRCKFQPMGKNKLKKFDDLQGYPHVFQYPFALLQEKGFEMRGKWGETFFKNNNPIVLELGCGKGEYAVGLARRFPQKNFIGIDIKGARMWSGAKQALEEGIKNVAFLRTHIELIDRFFAPGEVSEIWITFPDPQMKKVRKRLTSTRFMELYQQILTPDGLIHLKSDSPFMYTYTCEMVKANGYPVQIATDDLYHSGITDDILDLTSSTQVLGKPVGSDKSMNKSTYVTVMGLEAARKRAKELTEAAVKSVEPFGRAADELIRTARSITEREF